MDYFNIEEIIDWYERQGITIEDAILERLFDVEMIELCSGESGLNILQSKYNPIISFEGDGVTRDYQAEGLAASGLLFGFPLESTASLINRIRHLFLCDRKYVE